MLKKTNLMITLLSSVILSSAYAQVVDKAISDKIIVGLSKNTPDMPQINEISATPLPGIYEVKHSNTQIFYTSSDGAYVIQGHIIDTVKRKNLTQEKINKLNAIDFKNLPFKDAITIVKGNGKRKIAIFADPNCRYCKILEKEIEKMENITFYVFLYPVLGADSVKKANDIWCSKDKKQVWSDWMLNEKPITETSCSQTAINNNIALGKKHRIQGTPVLIFEDGTRIQGAAKMQDIEAKLKEFNMVKK